jgi:phosphoglycolate phosphatase-like HAD superfamily hydrolase
MLECHHKDIIAKTNIIKKDQFEKYLIDNNKKHIIFDFDETLCTLLIDWTPWRKELDELFAASDLTPKNEPDFNYAVIVNLYIEKYGKAGRDEIVALNYRIEKDYYSGYELSPIALPLLESVEKIAQLYLWTSNDRRTVAPILRELEIADKFQKIITRNDVEYVKPKAVGFALIYDERNARSQYLLIGDSRSDSGAATDAGIDFINIAEFNDFLD